VNRIQGPHCGSPPDGDMEDMIEVREDGLFSMRLMRDTAAVGKNLRNGSRPGWTSTG
jgi:hypothetical protein